MKKKKDLSNAYLNAQVVVAGVQGPEEDAEVDIDHVSAGSVEHVDDGGRAVHDEPVEDAPFGRGLGTVLARPVRPAAEGDHHELALIHPLHGEEVGVPKDDVLRHLAHRTQGLCTRRPVHEMFESMARATRA